VLFGRKYQIPSRKFFQENLPGVYAAVREKVMKGLPKTDGGSDGYMSSGAVEGERRSPKYFLRKRRSPK